MTTTNNATGEELRFDDSGLNTWTDEERFEVTRKRLAEYAAATNDPIPAHCSGDVASPVFAIVPVFEALLVPAVDVLPVELIPGWCTANRTSTFIGRSGRVTSWCRAAR